MLETLRHLFEDQTFRHHNSYLGPADLASMALGRLDQLTLTARSRPWLIAGDIRGPGGGKIKGKCRAISMVSTGNANYRPTMQLGHKSPMAVADVSLALYRPEVADRIPPDRICGVSHLC
jgi:hypothetical protein